MKLYTYWRSSAAYRVRIALNLKGLTAQHIPVHLARDGGEHTKGEYRAINPQGLVPALVTGDGRLLTQSLAIIEYLEEIKPEPPLLPAGAIGRAKVRAMAQVIACEIHPLNNLRVLKYLKGPLSHDQDEVDSWYRHWVTTSFDALEAMIGSDGFCHGGAVSLADVCLIPQIYNARRFNVDLTGCKNILKVEETCNALKAFGDARPENQPDAA